jgi:TRAP-type C4-dicarboxylate transport system permease large subunit
MLLTVPLLYPSFIAMGFDGVWVGVIIVIFIELGALTPPMGLNLFAIQSIAKDRSLGDIGRASMPYMLMISAFAFLLYAFPEIALWLPTMMKAG